MFGGANPVFGAVCNVVMRGSRFRMFRLFHLLRLRAIIVVVASKGFIMSTADFPDAITPTTEDVALARDSSRVLARFVQFPTDAHSPASPPPHAVRLQIKTEGTHADAESVSIPMSAFRLLMDILNQMGQGNGLALIPVHAELTTQQAAELLNVSRPFVIKLIDEAKLPCKMVGTHRRVQLSDLMDYKRKVDSDRLMVLEELAAEAQKLGLGY
jgi:excisionase family DNA binding protein